MNMCIYINEYKATTKAIPLSKDKGQGFCCFFVRKYERV